MFNHTGSLLLQTAILFAVNEQEPTTTAPAPVQTIEHLKNGTDVAEKCFGELGCYSVNFPWTDETRPVSHQPEPPEKVDPVFCLYTRQNPTDCQRLRYNDSSTYYHSSLVPTHRLYTIAHGFLENGDKKWIKVMTQRLLNISDVNVIVIGWQGGSSPPYTQAVANIRLVGTMAAHLLHALNRDLGVKTEFCHSIGHSLGAHLSGYIGNVLKTKFHLTLGRITALDPAEPHFSQTDPVVRLDPTDALYVDVIHTDATPFIKGGLGMDEPVGHLDFYPNGGENQPGCDQSVKEYMDKDESFFKAIRRFLGCDHVRSYEYFIESIPDRCEFLAIECDSWENFTAGNCFWCRNEMRPDGRLCSKLGLNSIRTVQKIGAVTGNLLPVLPTSMVKLYTITDEKPLYCKALYRITIRMSNSQDALNHGGEVGMFSIKIIGIKGTSNMIDLFKEQYFKPGTTYTQVFGASQIGRIRSAFLYWRHDTTFNILTWRIVHPTIYLSNVTIDSLEEDSSTTLCPYPEEKLLSGKEETLRPCGIQQEET
ncbi:pancreatic lipase-related protein 2 [Halyomorpha halys]|uniref:pancreatic lipase-related protein 2 n=1 Tax=Halyomorpha halys TaxID=286706 RepID=UPI0006D4E4FB|nr:pancreatic lipase-related protein 2-like [Halyomorpha halys]